MPGPVVAGLDGSPESLAAARWAAEEAALRGLPLRLVHAWVWEPTALLPLASADPSPQWAERVLAQGLAEVRSAHPSLTIEADQVADSAVNTLVDAAAEAELLVLGTRGLGPVKGFLVGSVALAVVARVSGPVVLVRAEQPPSSGEDVVCGLKLEDPFEELLDFAFAAARRRARRLRVVRSWNFPPAYGYAAGPVEPHLIDELETGEASSLTAAVQPWRDRFPDVEVVEQLEQGYAGSRLTKAGANAGLVVVGRRTRTALLGPQIGSVVHAVLHHCAAPVAVVPHA